MRILFAFSVMVLFGCEFPTSPQGKQCVYYAYENMSIAPWMQVPLYSCQEYLNEKLIVTVNGKIVIDEREVSIEGEGVDYAANFRQNDQLLLSLWDAQGQRILVGDVKVFGPPCVNNLGEEQRYLLIASGRLNFPDYGTEPNRTSCEQNRIPMIGEYVERLSLVCEPPVCEPLPE
jgi:hypothetical protein